MDVVSEAILFSVKAHEGMRRKCGGAPFILHPLDVMDTLAGFSGDRDLLAAAVLHDVAEDTDVTLEEIRAAFGERIFRLVAAETEDKHRDLSPEASWQMRKEEKLRYLSREATEEEQKLALADKLSNLRSLAVERRRYGDGVWQCFHQKDPARQAWYHRSVAAALWRLAALPAYREYLSLIDRLFAACPVEAEGTVLLVDGMNLLFQAFFGMPGRMDDREGHPAQGVFGFVSMLYRILAAVRPTHVLVLFDGEHHNERKDILPEYKANRPDYSRVPEDENPFFQLPGIFKALKEMGIAFCEVRDGEADDAIASCARVFGQTRRVFISSHDSDYFQLIGPSVSVFRYRGDRSEICDRRYLLNRLGIEPCQYADFKSLTGDHADNIPGARGIGPKTAAALLKTYGTLDRLLMSIDEIPQPARRESLAKASDRLRMNRRLIRLDVGAEIPVSPEEMAYSGGQRRAWSVMESIGLF